MLTAQLKEAISARMVIPDQPTWLHNQTLFLCLHGSHAYGTATPTSDIDIKGVACPPAEYFLGYANRFEQAITAEPYDLCIYDIRKFVHLAAECNPGFIEVLFVDDSDVLRWSMPFELIRENREAFLSQKAKHTFSGFATSQLKRIETHRRWLLNPPKGQPDRADYGLPERRMLSMDMLGAAEAAIQKTIDSWELDLSGLDDAARIHLLESMRRVIDERTTVDQYTQAGRLLGFGDNLLEYLKQERAYQVASRNWTQYKEWKLKRNPERAAMEAKYGVDLKHASHLVRLLRMCREILETGKVNVKRADADELLAIKGGAWTYEQIKEFAVREDTDLELVAKASKLPRAPNRAKLDKLCQDVVTSSLGLER